MNQVMERIQASGRIEDADVLDLRQKVFPDGVVDAQEARHLWHLARSAGTENAAWRDFFTEALTVHYVEQSHPRGHVSQQQADDLIERAGSGSRACTPLEFDLLVKIIDKAASVPDCLISFVLNAVRQTVLEGRGPARHGHAAPGVITQSDVTFLRQVLYAAGGAGHHGISRCEAQLLFDLNDATSEAENDPEWSDLFTKAIACYLMAHIGYQPPCRDEALRRSAWLDNTKVNTGSFLAAMGQSGFGGFRELFSRGPMEDERRQHLDAQTKKAEEITSEESAWLAARIAQDGVLHENEKALLDYMKSLGAELPPCLQTRIAELSESA